MPSAGAAPYHNETKGTEMEQMGFDESDLNADPVEQQRRLWNARRLAAGQKLNEVFGFRFLTIARDEGSLGNRVAQELSRRLGGHVFDKEIVTYIAKDSHDRENLVCQLDQKSQGLIQDAISRLLRNVATETAWGRDPGCLRAGGAAGYRFWSASAL
jgi:hypothetical protein